MGIPRKFHIFFSGGGTIRWIVFFLSVDCAIVCMQTNSFFLRGISFPFVSDIAPINSTARYSVLCSLRTAI